MSPMSPPSGLILPIDHNVTSAVSDNLTPEQRRRCMSRVRNRDTAPEVRLRRALWSTGMRYRLGRTIERARPDLVFPGPRVAVFIDGCFWHGCPRHYSAPVSNADFWRRKVERNQERDSVTTLRLSEAGWSVLRFWECSVEQDLTRVVVEIRTVVRDGIQNRGSSEDR